MSAAAAAKALQASLSRLAGKGGIAILGPAPSPLLKLRGRWLEYRIGQQGASTTLLSDARAKLNQAASLDPGDYAVHLYLGTILLQQDRDAAGAADQFRMFLAASPPSAVLQQAAPTLRAAFTQAGEPVPAEVPAD